MTKPGFMHCALVTLAATGLLTASCGRSSLRRGGDIVDTDGGTDLQPADAADQRGGDTMADTAGVQALSISPDVTQVLKGAEVAFAARLYMKDGSSLDATTLVEWSTSDPTVASARGAGVFAGLELGSATITARLGALQDTAELTVGLPSRVAVINIDPPSSVLIGTAGSLQLHAWAIYDNGARVDVTSLAAWTSSNTAVLTVPSAGRIVAAAAGEATVSAAYGGAAGQAPVRVTVATVSSISVSPPVQTVGVGGKATFTAEATLSDGTHQDVTANAIWTSAAPGVASVLDGVATARQAGKATISALLNGVEGRAQLTVSSAELQRLDIVPLDPKLAVGVAMPFTATGRFSDGSARDVTTQASWTSSSPGVLTVDSTGIARSIAPGTSVVTAAVSGRQATSTVTVSPAVLKTIRITPPSATLAPRGTQGLIATGTYDDGSTGDLTSSAIWSSSPPGVVSVDNVSRPGQVLALAAGVATVTASLGIVSGSATISVSPPALVKLAVTPSNASVADGLSVQLVATGTYADGLTVDVTGQATWSSSDGKVASVSNAAGKQGLVTGVSAGKASIIASLDGRTASAGITVTARLTSVRVTPAPASATLGSPLRFTATAVYSDGRTQVVTAAATWTSSNAAIAVVSNASGSRGLATTWAAGSCVISASYQGLTGTSVLTVTGATATLERIAISPATVTTTVNGSVQLTASGTFSDGSARNVTPLVTWSSSNPAVADVGTLGQVRAFSPGTAAITAQRDGVRGTATVVVR